MSVKACDRVGCCNIMCDILILDCSQYICASCYGELLAWKDRWEGVKVSEVEDKVRWFMNKTGPGETYPVRDSTDPEDVAKEFERWVPGRKECNE